MEKLVLGCIFAALTAGVSSARAENSTVPEVYQFGDEFLTLTLAPADWTTAEADAVAMGGHLVSITSQAEENFLISTFFADSSPFAAKPLWVGLQASIPGNTSSYTTWTDGNPVGYTNWNPGEPNDLNGDEDYVAMNWHYSFGSSDVKGTWDDLPLDGSTADYGGDNYRALGPYYGIVETPVPEPAVNRLLVLGGGLLGLTVLRRKRAVA